MAEVRYPRWFREIYSNHLFDTPIEIKNDSKYFEELQAKYKELIDLLSTEQNIEPEIVDHVKNESKKIVKIIDQYLHGKIFSAVKNLHKYIVPIINKEYFVGSINDIRGIKDKTNFHQADSTVGKIDLDLFHARINSEKKPFSRKDMLHIPFEERNKVAMQRFSVPGIPFYYIGSSSYVCWQEMGCPPDDQFEVSYIELEDSLSFFDLTMNVSLMRGAPEEINDPQTAKIWLSLWLLTIATSFKVFGADNRKFKSEYIISNLLSIVLCENNKIDGIIYNSKRLKGSDIHTFPVGINVALFSRPEKNQNSGYSNILERIKLSKPLNYYEYKQFKTPEKALQNSDEEMTLFADLCNQIPVWEGVDKNGQNYSVIGYYGDVDWREEPKLRYFPHNSNTLIANYRIDYADTIFHDFDLYLKHLPRTYPSDY